MQIPDREPTPVPRWLLRVALLTAAYFVAGRFGLSLAFLHASATAVWPPTGIAIAALLAGGRSMWPGVALGAFLVNLTTSGSAAASLGIAVGNTLEAVVAAFLVSRYAHGPRAFDRAPDVVRYATLAGLLAPIVAATIGVGSLVLAGLTTGGQIGAVWLTWWLGDAGGAIVVGPPLLLALTRRREGETGRAMEQLLLLAVLVATALVLFGGRTVISAANYPLSFLTMPVLLWPAFRFGPRITSYCVLVLVGFAVAGTLRGYGPFGRADPNEALLLLQTFAGVIAVTSLAIAALVQEHRRLSLAEQAARREAEEASRLKDRFLAVVSHELRTPINVVLGWAQMLRSGSVEDAAAARALEIIERNARAQAHLIDDLLDVSRFATGQARLEMQPTDFAPLVQRAVESLQPAALARHVALIVRAEDRPFPVLGDPQRLQQVVWNLLSNAVKFTPEGGTVTVDLALADPDVELRVHDSGRGISGADLSRVFEPFWQADTSNTRTEGGLGLGLAIVRHLVELQGGTVTADSGGVGQGSSFVVRFPYRGPE